MISILVNKLFCPPPSFLPSYATYATTLIFENIVLLFVFDDLSAVFYLVKIHTGLLGIFHVIDKKKQFC